MRRVTLRFRSRRCASCTRRPAAAIVAAADKGARENVRKTPRTRPAPSPNRNRLDAIFSRRTRKGEYSRFGASLRERTHP